MTNKRIFMFVGTTAELIKLAPVIREFNRRKMVFTIVASGQNDIRFEEFSSQLGSVEILYAITPKGKESSLILFFIWAVRAFFSLLLGMRSEFRKLNKSNSLFLVHGDTVSSLMGSLVAVIYGLKLVHIESGLRSFNFFEPFPEEICRFIISRIADVHFCPNEWSLNNLKSVKREKVNTYQNTLIESFWAAMRTKSHHPLVLHLQKQRKRYFVLVVHRQEHVVFGKRKTSEMLKFVLGAVPDNLLCVFLVHDLSADFIHDLGYVIPQNIVSRMMRVERLPYGDFMHLLQGSEFMITDGGSNQEEMYYMGKPCLLIRKNTERIEGLHRNIILSKNNKGNVRKFIKNYKNYIQIPVHISTPPSKIIVEHLVYGK